MTNLRGFILVVDDEQRNRRLLRQLLEAEGHRVSEAEDGAAALECVDRSPPDVILLDLSMPKVDGFEVCRRVKQTPATAHIPILLISALTEREDRLRGIEAGADDFIAKPIDQQEVLLRVRNAVHRQHLYVELQSKYKELRDMAELRDSLTSLINADTEALSSLMSQRSQPERAVDGKSDGVDGSPQEGGGYGAH